MKSKKINGFIFNYLFHLPDFGNGFWTQGTSLYRNGLFYWVESGQNIQFADWGPGQPDDYANNEECLELRKYSGNYKFNDLNCNDRNGFICESK